MSIVLEAATFIVGDISSQRKANKPRLAAGRAATAASINPKNLIGGVGYGPAGYTTSGEPTPLLLKRLAPGGDLYRAPNIDVATPTSFTPDQPIQGEQQQLYNYVNKPMLQQTTPAQIAQAEPTRMVMQSRQPTRRLAVRKPVRRVVRRKPVRRPWIPRVVRRAPTRRIYR